MILKTPFARDLTASGFFLTAVVMLKSMAVPMSFLMGLWDTPSNNALEA
jgi:hypothetical protein